MPTLPMMNSKKALINAIVISTSLILCINISGCNRKEKQVHQLQSDLPSTVVSIKPSDKDDVYTMQLKSQPDFKKMQALGKRIFFDPTLSASGKMSCASCHSPNKAFGSPNGLSVQQGCVDMKQVGTRAAPSLRYQQNVPAFTEHHFDEDIDESVDQGAVGGHDWDGRAATVHAQSALPLLSQNEMANSSQADVARKIRLAPYAAQFRDTFGADALDDDSKAFKWTTLAMEMFQQDPKSFYPYNSKYDAFLRGKVKLTKQEQHGLDVFNDPAKGNCASCHISRISNNGVFPAFSDFGILATGVPRNHELIINLDPHFYDMGACGPYRTDLKGKTQYCGAFRTPSLRNVALRKSFFHNGKFHSLEQVIQFYATRDTNPEKWYPKNKDGSINKYDDLPKQYHGNINTDAPFDRQLGDKPVLNALEIRDMILFLNTLTDGYEINK
jgi:cytochrome c peroxidase